jgi:hypothetical protein
MSYVLGKRKEERATRGSFECIFELYLRKRGKNTGLLGTFMQFSFLVRVEVNDALVDFNINVGIVKSMPSWACEVWPKIPALLPSYDHS